MAKTGVGLDIGTSAVKVVEVTGGKTVKVERLGMVPLPEGAFSGGVIKDSPTVLKALAELFSQSGIKNREVVLAVNGESLTIRHLTLPILEPEVLAKYFRSEAEKYIPFKADDVSLGFQIIRRDLRKNEMEVMLACAPREGIYSLIEILRQVGIKPVAIDIDPLAFLRSLGVADFQNTMNTAVLNIGAGTSDLMIVREGVPRFTRIIPWAGNRLTESLQRNLQLSFGEAEELKLATLSWITLNNAEANQMEIIPGSEENQIWFYLQEGFKELVVELQRSFEYYQLQQRDEAISQLIISGGGSLLPNLIFYLNHELAVPVRQAQSSIAYTCATKKLDAEFAELMPRMMTAFGLALREVTEE